jgi:hypothetical protein
LHLDNKDLIGKKDKDGNNFLEQVLGGKHSTITDKQWLEGGYFVDLPLSLEGSWIRIAVPDPEGKRFILDYVYVPFGSFIVRSGALFHSGHYGHPGNTRVHAIVFLKGCHTNSKQLGYLEGVTSNKESVAGGWAVEWADELKYNPQAASVVKKSNKKATSNNKGGPPQRPKKNFELAEFAMAYTNWELQCKRRSGTMYFNIITDMNYSGLSTNIWMLNPHCGCPEPWVGGGAAATGKGDGVAAAPAAAAAAGGGGEEEDTEEDSGGPKKNSKRKTPPKNSQPTRKPAGRKKSG